VGALGALDGGFFAQAAGPLVGAGGLVAALAGLAALEPAGVDVVAAAEEGTEEGGFGQGRGLVVD